MEGLLGALDAHWWWLGAGFLLIIAELLTGSLFLLWPGVAALAVAAVVGFAGDLSIAAQLALFAALATLLTVIGRMLRHRLSGPATDRPLLNRRSAQLIGRRVVAIDDFVNGEGAVRLDDGQWAARLPQGEAAAGSELTIEKVEGSTLIVAPAATG